MDAVWCQQDVIMMSYDSPLQYVAHELHFELRKISLKLWEKDDRTWVVKLGSQINRYATFAADSTMDQPD